MMGTKLAESPIPFGAGEPDQFPGGFVKESEKPEVVSDCVVPILRVDGSRLDEHSGDWQCHHHAFAKTVKFCERSFSGV